MAAREGAPSHVAIVAMGDADIHRILLKRFNTTQTASTSTASRVPYLQHAARPAPPPPPLPPASRWGTRTGSEPGFGHSPIRSKGRVASAPRRATVCGLKLSRARAFNAERARARADAHGGDRAHRLVVDHVVVEELDQRAQDQPAFTATAHNQIHTLEHD